MAAVMPISLDQRNLLQSSVPEERYTSKHSSDESDSGGDSSDSAADSESSDEASSGSNSNTDSDLSSEVSSSDVFSSDLSSNLSSSGQEDAFEFELDSASSSEADEKDLLSSNESGRPPELYYRRTRRTRRNTIDPSNHHTITDDFLGTLGDMARTDNVGYLAWLIPFTGICTMLGTEFLACVYHFSCSENYPTLSYAATFRPEGLAFTGGMCLTAIFIFVSVALFFWYLQLRMRPQKQVTEGHEEDQETEVTRTTKHLVVSYACLVSGVTAAISLFGLAVMDMRRHHDAHINFTIAFFIAAWATMIAVQVARKSVLHEDEADGRASGRTGAAYTLGQLLLTVGLASSFLFGLFFLCANGVWPNPLGFTAVQEAFFEAVAIVCQLLFMGTLSCELARLARLVEKRDYLALERRE
ncbi:hypothetical protein PHYBOEH_001765 [Phytophthora boehmeriae]|uniref:CWH43-like N-terminal domain-containing protein n=1 Tax=Phytophthora boehmeriae TaxID=109152 RepID=A0A8T1XCB9_9STRA|nr:hypothetical protein PHYBOEH_001765 [Phytophthora boehmeriae]